MCCPSAAAAAANCRLFYSLEMPSRKKKMRNGRGGKEELTTVSHSERAKGVCLVVVIVTASRASGATATTGIPSHIPLNNAWLEQRSTAHTPERYSTGHTRSNAQQSKLAPQRPLTTTMYSIHTSPSFTICSDFHEISHKSAFVHPNPLRSTLFDMLFPTHIQKLSTFIEKTCCSSYIRQKYRRLLFVI